MIGAASRSG